MEVLRCIAPVSGTTVVVVAVVEEVTRCGIAMPTDGTAGVLCGPEIAIGAIVNHGVVRYGHFRRVVGSDVDVAGSVGERLDVVLVVNKSTQADGDVSNITRRIKVGLVRWSVDKFKHGSHWEESTDGLYIAIIGAGEVGEALGAGLVAVVIVAESYLMFGRNVFLTNIADGVAQRHLIHPAVERIHGAIDSNRNQL